MKASALKSIFNNTPMGRVVSNYEEVEIIENAKSKRFHFKSKLCATCNNVRTQPADKAFDLLWQKVEQLIADNISVDNESLCLSNQKRINVHRYFAKILSCQIADCGGPRIVELINFAIGGKNTNLISLQIGVSDETLAVNTISENQYYELSPLKININACQPRIHSIEGTIVLREVYYKYSIDFSNEMNQFFQLHYTRDWRRIKKLTALEQLRKAKVP